MTVFGRRAAHGDGNPRESRHEVIAHQWETAAPAEDRLVPRLAATADFPALLALRDAAGADALSDPALLTETLLCRLMAARAVTIWEEAGDIVGFVAPDGGAIHLLVRSDQRSKGIGRELLATGCAALKAAGHASATVALAPGGTAERHYRAAGWDEIGRTAVGGAVLKKPL
jgi:GNAT superfamily N-acetyltransferase